MLTQMFSHPSCVLLDSIVHLILSFLLLSLPSLCLISLETLPLPFADDHWIVPFDAEYLPNGGDGNVPFQAVSLKDLSSSLPPHLLESSRHTPLSIEVESSDSCLSRLPLSGSNTCPTYSRPYELFPVNITAVDTATLRRVQAAHAAANMDKNSTTTFQVRGGVYDF